MAGDERIAADQAAKALADAFLSYSDEINQVMKASVDRVMNEVNEEIKSKVPFTQRTGKYVKAFRAKTTYEAHTKKTGTWYVNPPHYRLTHLLENGHMTRAGTRTRAFPHIQYGQELSEKRMEELIREGIKDGN